jgi:hypothetical protein
LHRRSSELGVRTREAFAKQSRTSTCIRRCTRRQQGQYLQLLDALDLLGLAYKRRAVDRGIIREYIRPLLLSPDTLSRNCFEEIRTITGVPNVYEHLDYLLGKFEKRSLWGWIRHQVQSILAAVQRKNSSRISATTAPAADTETCAVTAPQEQVVEFKKSRRPSQRREKR